MRPRCPWIESGERILGRGSGGGVCVAFLGPSSVSSQHRRQRIAGCVKCFDVFVVEGRCEGSRLWLASGGYRTGCLHMDTWGEFL